MLTRYRIEFYVLIALVIVLPILEAPKNIFWFAFICIWLFNRICSKDFGGKWDGWDSLTLLWISSGYVVAAFAAIHGNEWKGANDLLRYGSLLWALKRSDFTAAQFKTLLYFTALSTVIALSYAVICLYGTHTRDALELNSVGHTNHSAIYLAISYGALLSIVLAYWYISSRIVRIIGISCLLFFIAGIFVTGSRGAMIVSALLTLILGLAGLKRADYRLTKTILLIFLATIVSVGALTFLSFKAKNELAQENPYLSGQSSFLNGRAEIWGTGLLAWKQSPWFGVGMDNYGKMSAQMKSSLPTTFSTPFGEANPLSAPHAHNIYINTLVERGIYGFSILMLVFFCWGYSLVSNVPSSTSPSVLWALWGSSLSALVISGGVGLGNTTLHHEHALLSVLMLGLWLQYRKNLNVHTG